MSIQTVSFDNFAPRLKRGRVTPQGRRFIYELEDGSQQIVLPIEMADLLLLATGNYTMRQIIEKIFKRKGSLHFRTLFKTIHQLRDHGFLENGEQLESYSWWRSPRAQTSSMLRDRLIVRRRTLRRSYPMRFYFIALTFLAASFLATLDLPFPPLTPEIFLTFNSLTWAFLGGAVTLMILASLQALIKVAMQLLLTGNMFGLHLRYAPWGVWIRAADEPVFLITNRLFLLLYHGVTLLAPVVLVWPLAWIDSGLHRFAGSVALLKLVADWAPFYTSQFMQMARSLLSLSHSDLIAGYLREDSLLALLAPSAQATWSRRMARIFSAYIILWTMTATYLCLAGLNVMGLNLSREPIAAPIGWIGITSLTIWVLINLYTHLYPLMLRPVRKAFNRVRSWWQSVRPQTWPRDRLYDVLSELPLFSYFSSNLMERVLDQAETISAVPGQRLVTQGEVGRDLFVLLSGSVVVERTDLARGRQVLTTLYPTSIFGEMAMVEEHERTADVIAREHATVLRVSSSSLKQAAAENTYIREIEAFRNAILVNQFFTSAPMFKDLDEDTAHNIAMRSSLRHLSAGEVIIRQGEQGRSFFMVLRGSVEVRIDQVPVKTIRQGGFFGEIALIADIPRTATVVTSEDSVILEMAAANFWEILCQNIELAMFVEAVGESRLTEDLEVRLDRSPRHRAG